MHAMIASEGFEGLCTNSPFSPDVSRRLTGVLGQAAAVSSEAFGPCASQFFLLLTNRQLATWYEMNGPAADEYEQP